MRREIPPVAGEGVSSTHIVPSIAESLSKRALDGITVT